MQGWALKAGPEQVVRDFPGLCDRLKVEGADPDCVHALGHAVSVFLDAGVVERACATLQDRVTRLKCWYGYEMELASDTGSRIRAQGGPSAQDHADALVEFDKCALVAHPDLRDSCYQYREGVVYSLNGADTMQLADLCNGLPTRDATRLCFTGSGGELLSVSSGLDAPGSPMPLDFCGRARFREAVVACLREAAYTRMLVRNTLSAALEICEVSGEYAGDCERRARQDYQGYIARQDNAAGTGQLAGD